MFGLVEVITLLLGLSGFGVTPNPKAPTADQALQYAIPDADVVVHVDFATMVPGNYKALLGLPNLPEIKASPELLKVVRKVVTEVEGARNLAKATTGIDFTTDVTDATAFFQFVPNKDPMFVAAVRGKLSPAVIDKIAGMSGKQAVTIGTGKMIEMGGDQPALAITGTGVLLAGSPKLLRDRLAPGWKSPAHTPGTNLNYAAIAIDAHPIYTMAVTLGPVARKEINNKMRGVNFVSDLVNRHKAYVGSVYADGIGWTWVDSTKAGLESMAMMSDGFVEIMRAAQIAPRGIAKILLGAIESYKGTDKRVDEIIRRRGDIMKIVEMYTGDGTFKVSVNKDPAKYRLDVRATGKTLSEVIPAALVAPAFVAGFVLMGSRASSSSAPYPAQPVMVQPTVVQPKPPAPKKTN